MTELNRWLAKWQQPGTVWFIRRLTARHVLSGSTERNESPVPVHILARAFPELYVVRDGYTDIRVDLHIDSHAEHRVVGIEGIKGKLRGSPSARVCLMDLTGGSSAFLDPDNIGAMTLYVFPSGGPGAAIFANRRTATEGRVWITRSGAEEETVEGYVGPLDGRPPMSWRIREKGYENMDAYLMSMASVYFEEDFAEDELRSV